MKVVVQKYGGSSLADLEKIKLIAQKICNTKSQGTKVVAVVSAMGKTTNNFIAMSKELSSDPPKREMDMLLSAGERITMSLLCIALKECGVEAVSLTGSQAGIITNDCHNDARVIEVRPFRIEDELRKNKVVVIGGFQGVSYKRDVTTLGRGGTDTSAVAIAAALDAEACEIYSDVDGVYSADPNIVENTEHIPEISYQQMQEMSNAGARVLNAQCVEFAKKSQIAIYARASNGSDKETVVRKFNEVKTDSVNAVVYETDIERVRIDSDNFENVFKGVDELLKAQNIVMKELNVQRTENDSKSKASFIISYLSIYNWKEIKSELNKKFDGHIFFDEGISTVSLIGEGLNKSSAILTETLNLLQENKIEVYGVTNSSFRLSLVVKKELLSKTVKLCHSKWVEGSG